jgi:hypothetical protein
MRLGMMTTATFSVRSTARFGYGPVIRENAASASAY